jgi:hypothetical protein
MSVIASNIHILGNAFRLVVTSTSWRATKLEVEPWMFSFLAAGPKVKSNQNLETSNHRTMETNTDKTCKRELPFPRRQLTRTGTNNALCQWLGELIY